MDMLHFTIKKDKAYFWILILGAFICPLLALPLALVSLYHRKPSALYPLMLIFAIILCSVPITDDAYNYYTIFIQSQDLSLQALLENQKDILFYILSYFCNSFHLSYFMLRFFLVASALCMLAWLFNDICKQYPTILENRHYFFLSAGLFICTIDFVGITNALRYSYATVLSILSLYFIVRQQITRGIIFFVLAVSMHFGSWLYLPPILLFLFLHKTNINIGTRLALLVAAFLAGEFIFMYLYDHILPSSFQVETYVTGYWANIADYRSTKGLIYSWLHHYFVAFVIIFLFLFKKKIPFNLEKMAFGILLTYAAYLPMVTPSGRFFSLLKMFLILALIIQGLKQTNYMRFVRLWVLIGLMVMSQSLDIYRFREPLLVTDNIKFWVLPVTYLFDDYYTTEAYLFQNRSM